MTDICVSVNIQKRCSRAHADQGLPAILRKSEAEYGISYVFVGVVALTIFDIAYRGVEIPTENLHLFPPS